MLFKITAKFNSRLSAESYYYAVRFFNILMGTELEVDAISDGVDVLIPGIMQHIERAGVHSGDSIAVYPPYNLSDAINSRRVVFCRMFHIESGGNKPLEKRFFYSLTYSEHFTG